MAWSKETFATKLSLWFDTLSDEEVEQADMLVTAALDETKGNLKMSFTIAKDEFRAFKRKSKAKQ